MGNLQNIAYPYVNICSDYYYYYFAVVINNNNNNSPICYLGCLSTRRRHSQIRKYDHEPCSFTCPAHTVDVRQDIIPSDSKREKGLTASVNRGSNIQCLFLIIGQCTTSLTFSAIIGWGYFGTVPFSLLLVPDCLFGIRAVFST